MGPGGYAGGSQPIDVIGPSGVYGGYGVRAMGSRGRPYGRRFYGKNFSKPTASNLPQLSPLPAIERGTPTILRRLCEGSPRRLDLDSDRGSLHAG